MGTLDWVPQRIDSAICIEEADWGVLLGTAPVRSEGGRIGQGTLNCHAFAA